MYIVDTNVLMGITDLSKLVERFNSEVKVPIEVIAELDKLKTAEGERGFRARRAIRSIEKYDGKTGIDFIRKNQKFYHKFNRHTTAVDDLIISYFKKSKYRNAILVTNDVSMRLKAKGLGIKVESYKEFTRVNPGYTEVRMKVDEYLEFYENMGEIEGVEENEYLIIKDEMGNDLISIWRYLGESEWEEVQLAGRLENYLFKFKPKDEYQRCALDTLGKDTFTAITGPAGTGKTLLSFAYILNKIQKDGARVHIFVNPSKTRGSEELGFYPGTRDEKLLQNFIGDVLKNKIGDSTEVVRMMQQGSINVYPVSDIRGIEIGKGDIMYITEAQNLSVDMIKLAIQRCAEGSKIIIEGDPYTQVDKLAFEGDGNGLKRVLDVFGGYEGFGHIHLTKIYRSKMADRAEML